MKRSPCSLANNKKGITYKAGGMVVSCIFFFSFSPLLWSNQHFHCMDFQVITELEQQPSETPLLLKYI